MLNAQQPYPSFVRSFLHSFVRSFVRSFLHPFVHSFIPSFIHSTHQNTRMRNALKKKKNEIVIYSVRSCCTNNFRAQLNKKTITRHNVPADYGTKAVSEEYTDFIFCGCFEILYINILNAT